MDGDVWAIAPSNYYEIKIMKVAIIGSGPAGWAAYLTLSKANVHKITVFTLNDQHQEDPDFLQDVEVKGNRGNYAAYDFERHTKMSRGSGIFRGLTASKGVSGFSEVWGASLDEADDGSLFSSRENPHWNFTPLKSPNVVKNLSTGYQVESRSSKLAIDVDKCIKCGECILGCPVDAIWSSEIAFRDQSESKSPIENLVFREVTSVGYTENPFIEFIDGSREKFDLVILAAGTFASAKILARSHARFKKMQISDSKTTFMGGLKIWPQPKVSWVSLSQQVVTFTKDDFQLLLQLYPNSIKLKERALLNRSKLFQIAIRLVWPVLAKFITTGIAYLNDVYSDSMEIEYLAESDSLKVSVIENQKSIEGTAILHKLLRSNKGFLKVIFFRKLDSYLGVGTGFHFGNMNVVNESGELVHIQQELLDFSRDILLVGSASLHEVPAGPITSKLMRETQETIEKYLKTGSSI